MTAFLFCLIAALAAIPALTRTVLAFGSVTLRSESVPQKVTFTNITSEPIPLHGVTTTDTVAFPVRDDCPTLLQPTQRCTAMVIFIPQQPGAAKAMLDFGDGTHSLPLTGTGTH